MKFKTFKYSSVSSTNDVAINLIKSEKEKSGLVYSDKQTKGRGSYGKKWVSSKGNLFASIFFPLEKNYPSFSEFALISPLLVTDVIKSLCRKQKINLKFPNDILVNEKKICGILQEFITLKKKRFLVVGIGLNIVTNPNIKSKYKATNLLFECKKNLKIIDVINLIISAYEKFLINLELYKYVDFKKRAEAIALN
tara:strand:- start:2744 stop:3328 length:585 start_codon:yes stop_codon:yes gene_type:complete